MNRNFRIGAAAAAVGVAGLVSQARATLIAQDNFAGTGTSGAAAQAGITTSGLSTSANNDTGTGWIGNWSAGQLDGEMVTGPLSTSTLPAGTQTIYSYAPTGGNSVELAEGNAGNGNTGDFPADSRSFSSTPIDSTTGYSTLFVSFLVQRLDTNSRFARLSFYTGANGTGTNVLDIGANTQSGSYWAVGPDGSNPGTWNSSGEVSDNNTTNTYLIVAEISFGTSPTVTLWVNPTSYEPAANGVLTGVTALNTGLESLTLVTGSGAAGTATSAVFDQVMVGTTWADVVPEPSSLGLLLAPAAMMSARRRRNQAAAV